MHMLIDLTGICMQMYHICSFSPSYDMVYKSSNYHSSTSLVTLTLYFFTVEGCSWLTHKKNITN